MTYLTGRGVNVFTCPLKKESSACFGCHPICTTIPALRYTLHNYTQERGGLSPSLQDTQQIYSAYDTGGIIIYSAYDTGGIIHQGVTRVPTSLAICMEVALTLGRSRHSFISSSAAISCARSHTPHAPYAETKRFNHAIIHLQIQGCTPYVPYAGTNRFHRLQIPG